MRAPTSGVVVAKVTNVEDPQGLGRIEVRFPWLAEDSPRRWAPVASIMAGGDRGAFFMPEKEDEVLVAFEQGDWDHPYVIGFLWNLLQKPPSRRTYDRMIRTRNGHSIRFVDSTPIAGDKGALIIEDGHGNVIEMANARITIRSVAMLSIQALTVTINGRIVAPGKNPI